MNGTLLLTVSLIVAAFIALCIVVAWLVAGGSRTQPLGNETHADDPQQQGTNHAEETTGKSVAIEDARESKRNGEDHEEETAVARRLDWVAIFTLLLVIVGFLQVWVYVITERAYLSLSAINLDGPPTANKPIVLRLHVRNSGRTTAYVIDANVTVDAVALNEHLPDKPPYIPGGKVSAMLGPIVAGDTFYGTVRPQTREHHPFSWQTEWLTSGFRMYVFGFIKYDDGFWLLRLGEPRVTGFCARYDPEGNPATGMFATCDEENYRYGN